MNETFDRMLRACDSGLNDVDRRRLPQAVLYRIVQLCADAVSPIGDDEIPMGLQFIRATMIRPFDAIWRPTTRMFADVHTIDPDDAGLLRVEFSDGSVTWYSTTDVVEIPPYRAVAEDWNQRRRVQHVLTQDRPTVRI